MAMKEINNYSDIYFEFEETKIGRKVTGIKFIIKQNQNNKARKEKPEEFIYQIELNRKPYQILLE